MKKKILSAILCFFYMSCNAQIDTATLLRVAKINLRDKFYCQLCSPPWLNTYLQFPLEAIPLHTKGFTTGSRGTWTIFKIPSQTLCADTIGNKILAWRTPQSNLVDSPYTNTLIIAVENNCGGVYCIGGFKEEESDLDKFFRDDLEPTLFSMKVSKGRRKKEDQKDILDYIKDRYKIEGFEFSYVKDRLTIIASPPAHR